MLSKSIDINKAYSFREILNRISISSGDYLVTNMRINEFDISYDLINSENELSISLLLEGDTMIFPIITKLIVTLEKGDLIDLNNIKGIWGV